MEFAPKHPILEVTQEEMEKVRKFYNVNTDVMLQDMDTIEEWCRKEEHLAGAMPYLHREVLERLYLVAKGSVEHTKQNVEKFLTLRGMIADLALNKSFEEFDKLMDHINFLPLPKLTADLSRVIMVQFVTGKWDDFSFTTLVRYCYLTIDYRMHFDYNLTETFIVDFKNITVQDIVRMNPMILKKTENLSSVCVGTGINAIHIVNAPSFVETAMSVVKRGLSINLTNNVFVHNSYEDLYKMIPKELIPEDYGGNGPSCSKLSKQWKECLKSEEVRDITQNLNKLASDESKRSSFKFNQEYLGMPGSFKQLNMFDYLMFFDYNLTQTFVVDIKNFGVQDIVRINPLILNKAETLSTMTFGTTIDGTHVMNVQPFFDKLLAICKVGFSNITKKFFIHNQNEDLHKMIPKDIIPEEFGGTGTSCSTLAKQWKECFSSEEGRQIIENFNNLVSDESKRSSYKFNQEYLGMPGSFKKLNVD